MKIERPPIAVLEVGGEPRGSDHFHLYESQNFNLKKRIRGLKTPPVLATWCEPPVKVLPFSALAKFARSSLSGGSQLSWGTPRAVFLPVDPR